MALPNQISIRFHTTKHKVDVDLLKKKGKKNLGWLRWQFLLSHLVKSPSEVFFALKIAADLIAHWLPFNFNETRKRQLQPKP